MTVLQKDAITSSSCRAACTYSRFNLNIMEVNGICTRGIKIKSIYTDYLKIKESLQCKNEFQGLLNFIKLVFIEMEITDYY